MDTNRLRTGEKIAAGAAIALLILMFLPWFGLSEDSAIEQGTEFQSGASTEELEEASAELQEQFGDIDSDETSVNFNAWESFGFIDMILLIAIVIAIGVALARATRRDVDLPATAGTLVTAAGALATLLILYRIIDPPSVSFLEYNREFGVFLGLLAALGIAYGGFRAMRDEGTTTARPAGGATAAPPPTQPPAGGAAPPPPAPGTTPPPPGTPGAPPPSGPTA